MGAFCCWASEFGIATHSIYQRYNLPVILGGSNDHRSSRPFHSDAVVFRNSPYDLINMKFAAIYAAEIAEFKRIFLIDDGSAFGRTQVNEFAKVVEEKAGKSVLIGRESIAQGEKDFTPLLTRIKSLNPDLLYFGGRIIEASLMRQQMIRLGSERADDDFGRHVFRDLHQDHRRRRRRHARELLGPADGRTIRTGAAWRSRRLILRPSSTTPTRLSGRWPTLPAKSSCRPSRRPPRTAA